MDKINQTLLYYNFDNYILSVEHKLIINNMINYLNETLGDLDFLTKGKK